MKIFLDTAHAPTVEKKSFLIDGLTTNPTNLAHEGGNPLVTIKKLCALLPDKDISVEITEIEPQAALKQARLIAQIAPTIVVKIPCHEPYLPIIKQLIQEKIRVNITLLFTLAQGLFMAKMGAYYISPFIGRWADAGLPNTHLLAQLRTMIDRYSYTTKLLAASLRDVSHLQDAIEAGADIATIPIELLDKIFNHPLTIEGINKFDTDWQKLKNHRFP